MTPTDQPQAEYYTVREVAVRLALDRTTIARACRRGMWNAVKLLGRWRVPCRAFNAWLAAQQINALVPGVELVEVDV